MPKTPYTIPPAMCDRWLLIDPGPGYAKAPRLSIQELGLNVYDFSEEEDKEIDLFDDIPTEVELAPFAGAALKNPHVTLSQARPLLTLPTEIQVAIYKRLSYHAHDLLKYNPITMELLSDIPAPAFGKGVKAMKHQYPIFNKTFNESVCAWCGWKGSPASPAWFRHVMTETSRLGLDLTVGMLKGLAYEALYEEVTTPVFGRPDPGDWFLDDRMLDELDDIGDQLVRPVRQRIRMVSNIAASVAQEQLKKNKQAKEAGQGKKAATKQKK